MNATKIFTDLIDRLHNCWKQILGKMTMTDRIQKGMKKEGKLIVFTAPSGAGKTTLVRHILKYCDQQMAFSVSATTRPKRDYETDGHDYYFISKEAFVEKKEAGDFLEWEEVYDGNYYGTLKSEIERIWRLGKTVLFDVDVKGAKNIKDYYGKQALVVFVKPPSFEILKKRLINRNTESPESLQKRIARMEFEMSCESMFDISIVNDDLETAKQKALQTVLDFITPSIQKQQKTEKHHLIAL